MKITESMRQYDDVRWASRDVKMELKYCGSYMKDRIDMRNDDLRFYAWLHRAALRTIEENDQESVPPIEGDPVIQGFRFVCGKCHWRLYRNNNYCSHCGKKVKWSDANGKKMDQKT